MIFLNSVLTELNNTTSLKIDCNKNAMTTQEVKRHLDVVYVYIKQKPTNMCVLMYILDISH